MRKKVKSATVCDATVLVLHIFSLASFGSSRVWTRCTMHFILRAQAIVQLAEAGYGRTGSAPGDE